MRIIRVMAIASENPWQNCGTFQQNAMTCMIRYGQKDMKQFICLTQESFNFVQVYLERYRFGMKRFGLNFTNR